MKRLTLILFVLMIMAPMTTVMARDARHPRYSYERPGYDQNYLSFKLGAFMPDDDAGYLDTGYTVGAALGHKFNRNFALEFGLDYTVTDFDEDYGYNYRDVYITTLGIPVTAKIIAPLSNQVDLYAGVGLGLYFTDLEYDDIYDDRYYHEDSDSLDETFTGYHLLVGADIKMSPYTALTTELKYTGVDEDFDDDYFYDLEVGGTTASVGLKFLF